MPKTNLPALITGETESKSLKLRRSLLKDQSYVLLREYIISGRIPPGTKLVEREVAQMLGISRAPARDALLQLEREGLVISKPDARYVIELNERDIRELYQVRLALEKLAAELAALNTSPENRSALAAELRNMEEATEKKDHAAFGRSDLNMHRLIWRQADNHHLSRALHAMLGPIFMMVANNAERINWQKTLQSNQELVASISSGDAQAASKCMEEHVRLGLARALQVIRASQQSPTLNNNLS